MKKTSLNDIAKQLGVSKTLVSLILNGKAKEQRIGDEITKKVIKLARELNYKPNQIAKGLRTGKTNTIGLIIADIANPFFGKLGREIENKAAEYGYRIIFCSSDENADNFRHQVEMLQLGQVDGFIISPPAGGEDQINELKDSKIPFVLIDRYFPDIETNYVGIDNFKAAYNGAQHLIQKGYKKIACVSINESLVNMCERVEGYRSALKDSKIKIVEDRIKILPFSHEKDDVLDAIKQLISVENEKTEAILFTTSKVGIMGLESIYSLGLKIPNDLAVVSFDDPDAYKISFPPISAIAQPLREMGIQSVEILLNMIKNKKKGLPAKMIKLETKFIQRKSSGD